MKTYLKDLTPAEVIRRFKDGEVVKCETDEREQIEGQYKMIDGIICGFFEDGDIFYGSGISVSQDNGFYFETPDELKLEVGKCYKTRDGRKAFVSFKTKDCFCGAVAESPDFFDWSENGKYMYKENELGYDLISEWSDDDVEKD